MSLWRGGVDVDSCYDRGFSTFFLRYEKPLRLSRKTTRIVQTKRHISDDFWLRSPVNQRTFQPGSATSNVGRVHRESLVRGRHVEVSFFLLWMRFAPHRWRCSFRGVSSLPKQDQSGEVQQYTRLMSDRNEVNIAKTTATARTMYSGVLLLFCATPRARRLCS